MTPDRIKAFLDDADGDFYAISPEEALEAKAKLEGTQRFSEENLVRVGGRSHDLAQMLRDAFMAGARAVVEHRKDVYSEEWWWDGYEGNIEDDAPEYAAKIMGGAA